jgi:hypothetical protein
MGYMPVLKSSISKLFSICKNLGNTLIAVMGSFQQLDSVISRKISFLMELDALMKVGRI